MNTSCYDCDTEPAEPTVFRITFPDGSQILTCEEHALSYFSAPTHTVLEIIT